MTAQAMMRVKFKRPRDFRSGGKQILDAVKDVLTHRLVMGLTDMQNSILETPVYTGRTLVNFRWAVGSPVEGTRAAVKEPDLPGKTSDLPVGGEPRRPANAAIVVEEFLAVIAAVKANPFQSIYLNNNLAHFSDVEYGTYAQGSKTSRTPPGGMTRRGETLLEYSMMGFMKRVA